MADVFISYASEDRTKVAVLARLFAEAGWTTWWDRQIDGGRKWRQEIEDEIAACKCVLVFWSRASVSKDWVLREAAIGRDRGVLLPVLLEPVPPPDGFEDLQAVRLTAWLGDERSFELRPLLGRVAAVLETPVPTVDERVVQHASTELTRLDVASAVFQFCAVRLAFGRMNARGQAIPSEILEGMRDTYDELSKALSPVTSDELHELIARYEAAFVP